LQFSPQLSRTAVGFVYAFGSLLPRCDLAGWQAPLLFSCSPPQLFERRATVLKEPTSDLELVVRSSWVCKKELGIWPVFPFCLWDDGQILGECAVFGGFFRIGGQASFTLGPVPRDGQILHTTLLNLL
jgi:hypothetical protein